MSEWGAAEARTAVRQLGGGGSAQVAQWGCMWCRRAPTGLGVSRAGAAQSGISCPPCAHRARPRFEHLALEYDEDEIGDMDEQEGEIQARGASPAAAYSPANDWLPSGLKVLLPAAASQLGLSLLSVGLCDGTSAASCCCIRRSEPTLPVAAPRAQGPATLDDFAGVLDEFHASHSQSQRAYEVGGQGPSPPSPARDRLPACLQA